MKNRINLFVVISIFFTTAITQPHDNTIIGNPKEWCHDFIHCLRGDEKYTKSEIIKARIHTGLCAIAVATGSFFIIRYVISLRKKKISLEKDHRLWFTKSNRKRMNEVYYNENKWPIEVSATQLEKRLEEAFPYWKQQKTNEKSRKITKEKRDKVLDLVGIMHRTQKKIGDVNATKIFENVATSYKQKYENVPLTLNEFIAELSSMYNVSFNSETQQYELQKERYE